MSANVIDARQKFGWHSPLLYLATYALAIEANRASTASERNGKILTVLYVRAKAICDVEGAPVADVSKMLDDGRENNTIQIFQRLSKVPSLMVCGPTLEDHWEHIANTTPDQIREKAKVWEEESKRRKNAAALLWKKALPGNTKVSMANVVKAATGTKKQPEESKRRKNPAFLAQESTEVEASDAPPKRSAALLGKKALPSNTKVTVAGVVEATGSKKEPEESTRRKNPVSLTQESTEASDASPKRSAALLWKKALPSNTKVTVAGVVEATASRKKEPFVHIDDEALAGIEASLIRARETKAFRGTEHVLTHGALHALCDAVLKAVPSEDSTKHRAVVSLLVNDSNDAKSLIDFMEGGVENKTGKITRQQAGSRLLELRLKISMVNRSKKAVVVMHRVAGIMDHFPNSGASAFVDEHVRHLQLVAPNKALEAQDQWDSGPVAAVIQETRLRAKSEQQEAQEFHQVVACMAAEGDIGAFEAALDRQMTDRMLAEGGELVSAYLSAASSLFQTFEQSRTSVVTSKYKVNTTYQLAIEAPYDSWGQAESWTQLDLTRDRLSALAKELVKKYFDCPQLAAATSGVAGVTGSGVKCVKSGNGSSFVSADSFSFFHIWKSKREARGFHRAFSDITQAKVEQELPFPLAVPFFALVLYQGALITVGLLAPLVSEDQSSAKCTPIMINPRLEGSVERWGNSLGLTQRQGKNTLQLYQGADSRVYCLPPTGILPDPLRPVHDETDALTALTPGIKGVASQSFHCRREVLFGDCHQCQKPGEPIYTSPLHRDPVFVSRSKSACQILLGKVQEMHAQGKADYETMALTLISEEALPKALHQFGLSLRFMPSVLTAGGVYLFGELKEMDESAACVRQVCASEMVGRALYEVFRASCTSDTFFNDCSAIARQADPESTSSAAQTVQKKVELVATNMAKQYSQDPKVFESMVSNIKKKFVFPPPEDADLSQHLTASLCPLQNVAQVLSIKTGLDFDAAKVTFTFLERGREPVVLSTSIIHPPELSATPSRKLVKAALAENPTTQAKVEKRQEFAVLYTQASGQSVTSPDQGPVRVNLPTSAQPRLPLSMTSSAKKSGSGGLSSPTKSGTTQNQTKFPTTRSGKEPMVESLDDDNEDEELNSKPQAQFNKKPRLARPEGMTHKSTFTTAQASNSESPQASKSPQVSSSPQATKSPQASKSPPNSALGTEACTFCEARWPRNQSGSVFLRGWSQNQSGSFSPSRPTNGGRSGNKNGASTGAGGAPEAAVADSDDDEDEDNTKSLFALCDKDHDGLVSVDDCVGVFSTFNVMSNSELRTLFGTGAKASKAGGVKMRFREFSVVVARAGL